MKHKRKRTIQEKCLIILAVFLVIVFCISSTYVISISYTKYQEQKSFENLGKIKEQIQIEDDEKSIKGEIKQTENQEELQINQTQEEEKTEEKNEEKTILPEYEELYAQNNDLYGWIEIEDTIINYPVMYTPEEPHFYDRKNWQKQKSEAGTPFIDERTKPNQTENTIIYSHNMNNDTMFGTLEEYKDILYYEKHKYIQFDTIYERSKYEIIAVSKAVAYYQKSEEFLKDKFVFYNYIELNSQEAFYEYLYQIKENAYFETGVTAEYGDELITLCTCDYWTTEGRLLVVAKKIE